MSQAGVVKVTTSILPPTVATSYVCNTGTATPAAHVLNVLGASSATTSGSGNTITITVNQTVLAYTPTAISYIIQNTDDIIGVTSTAAPRTMTLPNSGLVTGKSWTIKDESGGAATNNITISGNGANIDGSPTFAINTNYGAVTIYYNGSNFFIV